MRSFSNLWFWIALAVAWSTASHWILGVPYDLVQRAGRHGGDAQRDLEDLVRVNVNRILYIARVSGLWLLGFAFFMLTSLAILAFWYDIEFAQALFLLGLPMSFVGALSLSTARLIEAEQPLGEALRKRFCAIVFGPSLSACSRFLSLRCTACIKTLWLLLGSNGVRGRCPHRRCRFPRDIFGQKKRGGVSDPKLVDFNGCAVR